MITVLIENPDKISITDKIRFKTINLFSSFGVFSRIRIGVKLIDKLCGSGGLYFDLIKVIAFLQFSLSILNMDSCFFVKF